MPLINKNIFRRILPHLLFWMFYLAFNSFMNGFTRKNFGLQFQLFLCYMPVVMAATYFTIYVLIPKLLLKKRFLLFAGGLILSSLFFSLLQRINLIYIIAPVFDPDYLLRETFFSFSIIYRVMMIYEVVVVAVAIKLLKYWYETEYKKQQAEKEKLHSELAYLKAQIHPHFLFNTLNNLYALTLKNDPRASEIVLKLSDLLDYILYKCNTPFINLDAEVSLLDNYISLEELRYGERLHTTFQKNGDLSGQRIAPLLLLPLVENAFKHGTSKNPVDPWLHLTLDLSAEQLTFTVKNGKCNQIGTGNDTPGIGLQNVRRRLALLYPDAHSLSISDGYDEYEAVLKINLTEIGTNV